MRPTGRLARLFSLIAIHGAQVGVKEVSTRCGKRKASTFLSTPPHTRRSCLPREAIGTSVFPQRILAKVRVPVARWYGRATASRAESLTA